MKNHFIPCFYTKRWTGSDGRLVRYTRPHYNLVDRRVFPTQVGFETDLYTLPGLLDDEKNFLENGIFRELDQRASDILSKIETDGAISLTLIERQAWTTFLISLRQRNKTKLEEIALRAELIFGNESDSFRREFERLKKTGDPGTFEDFLLHLRSTGWFEQKHRLLVQDAILIPESTKAIMNFHWSILNFSPDHPELLTSDRPIIVTNGISHREGHLALPIGPRKLFVAVKDVAVIEALVCDPTLSARTNQTIVEQAKHEVYSANLHQSPFIDNRFKRSG